MMKNLPIFISLILAFHVMILVPSVVAEEAEQQRGQEEYADVLEQFYSLKLTGAEENFPLNEENNANFHGKQSKSYKTATHRRLGSKSSKTTSATSKSAKGPTSAPSESSTSAPSKSSTSAPSESPTMAPVDPCPVQVEVGCVSKPFSDNCVDFNRTQCMDKATKMGFRFNGGGCSQNFTIQPPDIYGCDDFNGGPPISPGEEAYILVTDINGEIDYFSGLVKVGEWFSIQDPNANVLENKVNVTIYANENTLLENILQKMGFDTSCGVPLFIKDRYGSIELLSFENPEQGFVDCVEEVTLIYNISNMETGNNDAILQSLTTISSEGGFVNLTDQVMGVNLTSGESLDPISIQIEVDLSSINFTKTFDFITVVSASVDASPDGFTCHDIDNFNFTVNNPNPPPFLSIPTLSPTLQPTDTLAPTIALVS